MTLVVMMCRDPAVIAAALGVVITIACGPPWKPQIRELDPTAGHFPNEILPLALAAAIEVGGPSSVAVANDVINLTDPGHHKRIPARLVRNLMSLASQEMRRMSSKRCDLA
jgi:hypothetical protein